MINSELKNKKIYLEYCQKSNVTPMKQVLDILDHKTTRCVISKDDQHGENKVGERELLSLSIVLSENLTNFMELEISHQLLNTSMLATLASGIRNNTNLIRLSLNNDFIDDQGVIALIPALCENQTLEEIDLSHNRIRDISAGKLAIYLQNTKSPLRVLNLSQNLIETDFFGEALRGNNTLQVLNVAFNNYATDSFELLFKGVAENTTLQILDLRGMSLAANLNALALTDLFKENSTLQELFVELDFELLDEDMIKELERCLMDNVSLMILRSVKYDVQQDDHLTGGIFRIIQANQWIMENYERLCNNQVIECEESLQEIIKYKLEVMVQRMKEDTPYVSLQSNRFPETYSQAVNILENFKKTEFTKLITSDRSHVPNLFSPKRMEKPTEDFFQDLNTIEYKNAENRLMKQAEDQERKLFSQLTEYFDRKFDKVVNMMQNSVEHCERRVDTLETKLNLFQQPLTSERDDRFGGGRLVSPADEPEIKRSEDLIEPRLHRVENNFNELQKDLQKLSDTLQAMRFPTSGLRSMEAFPRSIQELRSAPEEIEEDERLNQFMKERIAFEKQAQRNFLGISERMNEISEMLNQVVKSQQEANLLQKNMSMSKPEIGTIERQMYAKIDQLLNSRFKDFEASLKSGYTGLRNTVYETQNRLKNLEYSVLENSELNLKNFKKKAIQQKEATETQQQQQPPPRIESSHEKKNFIKKEKSATLNFKEDVQDVVVSSFESPQQEQKDIDNPISLKDLQSASTKYTRNQLRDQIKAGKSLEQSQSRPNSNKESLRAEMPESIRKVKEEIKKKIESYKSAVSPFKNKYEDSESVSDKNKHSTYKSLTGINTGYADKKLTTFKTTKESEGLGGTPSHELMEMLKRKGFNFHK